MPKLTKRFVDSLKPVSRDTLYRDTDLKGFALRVKPPSKEHPNGARNAAGRTRQLKLGAANKLTPEEARRKARIELGKVAGGQDPSASRGADRKGLTVAQLCDHYLRAVEHGVVLGKRGRRKSPLTIEPLIGSMLVKAVTRQDVTKFLEAVQLGTSAGKSANGTGNASAVSL